MALIMSYVNRKSVCYQWLLITQPVGFLPPAKFKFILSWIFITARNNSGHDIMARSLCATVRNEKWHVFAQGYLHDLVYWIFIISRQTSRNIFSTNRATNTVPFLYLNCDCLCIYVHCQEKKTEIRVRKVIRHDRFEQADGLKILIIVVSCRHPLPSCHTWHVCVNVWEYLP